MRLWWRLTSRSARRTIERLDPCGEHCVYCCACPPCTRDRDTLTS